MGNCNCLAKIRNPKNVHKKTIQDIIDNYLRIYARKNSVMAQESGANGQQPGLAFPEPHAR